jgi:hypothetical protein
MLQRPEKMITDLWCDQIWHQFSGTIYNDSLLVQDQVTAFMARQDGERWLWLAWNGKGPQWLSQFTGEHTKLNLDGNVLNAIRCKTTADNARAMRNAFPFTRPQMVGLRKSFGFGDRLGLATTGHIMTIRDLNIFPVLAQQSIREMTRTKRSAQEVMDDACFAVFQTGFDKPFGSDADHLKNEKDIDTCIKAGFLSFTIDPGEHVDDAADTDAIETLNSKFDTLPWSSLNITAQDTLRRYENHVNLPSGDLPFGRDNVLRAGVKYGRAIAHTLKMYQYLLEKMGDGNFELEISVDETSSPTTPQEHYYVASELKRLGVKWVSLAPRFVGRFEKGVDYIGDLGEFRKKFVYHAEIAKHLGPYKISIHSGSDKFSVYPIIAELCGELVHVKTAGTSYLEALRVISKLAPDFFREILDFARSRYVEDHVSYHVSADLKKVPSSKELSDYQLSQLLDDFDAREVLHVTFGSVLTTISTTGELRFRNRLLQTLIENEEAYQQCLVEHFHKHVDPFTR